ncbi:uncharacterized protein ACN427_005377 isoform 2-T2 [Glossina fuscipes fuscipes]
MAGVCHLKEAIWLQIFSSNYLLVKIENEQNCCQGPVTPANLGRPKFTIPIPGTKFILKYVNFERIKLSPDGYRKSCIIESEKHRMNDFMHEENSQLSIYFSSVDNSSRTRLVTSLCEGM